MEKTQIHHRRRYLKAQSAEPLPKSTTFRKNCSFSILLTLELSVA